MDHISYMQIILYLGKVVPIDTGFREVGGKGARFEAEDPGQGVFCQTTVLQ